MTPPLPSNVLAESGDGASASNLAFALAALPRDRRRDMRIFYAFCRIVDDLADEETEAVELRRARLDTWRDALENRPDRLPADLRDVIERHAIDRALLVEIVNGVSTDLGQVRFDTFNDLRRYCWQVASAVGLVSARIFGCRPPAADKYAETLGLALQLTNILRDVREDAERNRIYLPLEDIENAGVSRESILAFESPPGLRDALETTARRAETFFDEARAAFPLEYKRELIAAELMRDIYSTVLRRMRTDGFQVMDRRYRLSRAHKLWLYLKRRLQ